MDNELSKKERITAGILLILFTCLPAIFIVGLWPDRLPGSKDFIKPLYYGKPFHVRLANIKDITTFESSSQLIVGNTPIVKKKKTTQDATGDNSGTVQTDSTDTTTTAPADEPTDVTDNPQSAPTQKTPLNNNSLDESKLLHINTILLLLVALGGFLGNMIYISASLTTFIGAKKFVRSWLLWYIVKPFSAAALAIALYFVFRGGFLNTSDDVSNINLYGIMTVALLTGLFTDRATLKLKEVFNVIFNPKEERADTLSATPAVKSVSPTEIEAGKENTINIAGENLTATSLNATINNEAVHLSNVTDTAAVITYTIPDSQKTKKIFVLSIKDADGNVAGSEVLILKDPPLPGGDGGQAPQQPQGDGAAPQAEQDNAAPPQQDQADNNNGNGAANT